MFDSLNNQARPMKSLRNSPISATPRRPLYWGCFVKCAELSRTDSGATARVAW